MKNNNMNGFGKNINYFISLSFILNLLVVITTFLSIAKMDEHVTYNNFIKLG